ncbi:MAG: ribonuclease HII [Gemmatimonadetes bacterium]|nr:ribonuclease HII [Gemmatimonadota bacterium]
MERDLRTQGLRLIAGVDEVGRGPLAGPVVACAIIMPPDDRPIRGVNDSKQLTPAVRERLAVEIRARALALGIGAASVREVDRLNIYHATVLAMRRALGRLALAPDEVLVDGNALPTLGRAHVNVIKGDSQCYAIACASIVAKALRDGLMTRLARRHPAFGWERNAGYGTAEHIAALTSTGPTPHHRRSFGPVQGSLFDG